MKMNENNHSSCHPEFSSPTMSGQAGSLNDKMLKQVQHDILFGQNSNFRGQSLIIVLMIVALVTTIVGGTAFQTITQTRITNTQSQEQIAEKGAQGILEKILHDEDIDVSEDLGVGLNPKVTPVFKNSPGTSSYTTDTIIEKDNQYILYLTSYDRVTNSFDTNLASYFGSGLTVFFDSENNCPVLELTYIGISGGTPTIIKREATGICGTNTVGVVQAPSAVAEEDGMTGFSKKWTIAAGAPLSQANIVIVRPLFGDTKLAFKSADPAGTVPAQGETITATVQTVQGTQKQEQVYRPYPQVNEVPVFLSIF